MASPFGTTHDFAVDPTSSSKYTWNGGVRETSMHNYVINLSTDETVMLNCLPSEDVDSASPEWMQRSFAAIDPGNAFPEAADYTYVEIALPTRVQNVLRHFRKTAQVSGRAMKDKYFKAVANAKMYQIEQRSIELKRDMEYALLNSTISNVNESTATQFRGILQSISGRTSGSPQDGTVTAGNNVAVGGALTTTNFKTTLLKGVWDDNFMATDVFLPASQQIVLDTFVFNTADFVNQDKAKTETYKKVFVTPFGVVTTHIIRDLYWYGVSGGNPASGSYQMIALDLKNWVMGWYRKTWMEEPPKDGDRWRGVIQAELTLKDYAATSGFSLGTLT